MTRVQESSSRLAKVFGISTAAERDELREFGGGLELLLKQADVRKACPCS